MLTRGRVFLALTVLILGAMAWTSWLGYRAYSGLGDAEVAVEELRSAAGDNRAAQEAAVADLASAADRVESATAGWWWGGLSRMPLVGDDFNAVRVVGTGLDMMTADGVEPLLEVDDQLQDVADDGRLRLDVVEKMQAPLDEASRTFRAVAEDASVVDETGLAGVLQSRFVEYRQQLTEVADGLGAGATAAQLLPPMAGKDGERNYLLIFQNNAEIRATGGLPGSWARLRADNGALSLEEQGAWTDFPQLDEPVIPLSQSEQVALQGGYGLTFQSAGYSLDFPRAARIWEGFWDNRYPDVELDGVVALDPVALSYLVDGTGPVEVGSTTLTGENLVEQVLSEPYLRLADPADQDAFFQRVARSVFGALTTDLASPVDLVAGLSRAGQEGRFLVAPFREDEAATIDGTRVSGELPADDATSPYVGVGLNDATGAKMSYYLRYDAGVTAVSCSNSRQQLDGSLSLRQNIAPADAATLPPYITGGGAFGTEPGSQLLSVQLYGPPGGTFGPVQVDGRTVGGLTAARLGNGQPVVRLSILLDSRDDVRVTWSMESGEGQVGDPVLQVTPSVVPGDEGGVFPSACA